MSETKDWFDFDLQLFAEEEGGDDEDPTKEDQEDDPGKKEKRKEDEYDDLEKIRKTIESDEISSELLKKVINDLIEDSKKYRNLARERLREVMTKKEKLKKLEEEQERARMEALKKKEEYKKLVEEMEPKLQVLTKDVEKTQEFFDNLLRKKREQMPEEYRDLIPEGLDIREKIQWIDNFLSKLPDKKGENKTNVNVNTGPAGPGKKEEEGEKKPSESKIREELMGAKSMKEFEEILKKYGRKMG